MRKPASYHLFGFLISFAGGLYCHDTPIAAACFVLSCFLFSGILEFISKRKIRRWLSLALPIFLCLLGSTLYILPLLPGMLPTGVVKDTEIPYMENLPQIPYNEGTSEEISEQDTGNNQTGLYIAFFDLGQSDATFITCDGESMLVDAGNPDLGTSILGKCRKIQGFSGHLTYLVLTHPHTDHIGSAASIISHMTPSLILLPDIKKAEVNTKCYEQLLGTISFYQIPCEHPKTGDTYMLGSAQVTILYEGLADTDNLNNVSLMLSISYGGTSLLLTGDAEEEEELAALSYVKEANVMQAGHHGSSTSNTKTFLGKVLPKTIVISCGEANEYGHPHKQALDRMKDVSASIYRTDIQGDVFCMSDGKEVVFLGEPWYIGKRGTNYLDTEAAETENRPSEHQNLFFRISDFVKKYWKKAYTAAFQ